MSTEFAIYIPVSTLLSHAQQLL